MPSYRVLLQETAVYKIHTINGNRQTQELKSIYDTLNTKEI